MEGSGRHFPVRSGGDEWQEQSAMLRIIRTMRLKAPVRASLSRSGGDRQSRAGVSVSGRGCVPRKEPDWRGHCWRAHLPIIAASGLLNEPVTVA